MGGGCLDFYSQRAEYHGDKLFPVQYSFEKLTPFHTVFLGYSVVCAPGASWHMIQT